MREPLTGGFLVGGWENDQLKKWVVLNRGIQVDGFLAGKYWCVHVLIALGGEHLLGWSRETATKCSFRKHGLPFYSLSCYEILTMRKKSLWLSLSGLGVGLFVACSADPPVVSVGDIYTPYWVGSRNPYTGIHDRANNARAETWKREYGRTVTSTGPSTASLNSDPMIRSSRSSSAPSRSPSSVYRQVNVKKDFLSYGARGRSRKSMSPRYITIHSTQNWSRGADALRHSKALKNGALGRLSWHYTVDEDRAVQHLPTNERGNHADYDGPGNRYSIGIEMCEHPGNSRSMTLERTAKLAAWLCVKYDLPVSRVVPHYKWPRRGKNPPNKNCPHFLLSNGRPGAKWQGFLKAVDVYRRGMLGR
jgi:N-acetylmuramoyl-L-alanine amidase